MYTDTRFIHYLVIFTILTETLKLQLHNFYIQWQLQFYLLAEAHNAVNILIQNENQVSQYKSTCSELYCNVETCDTNFCTNFSVAPHLSQAVIGSNSDKHHIDSFKQPKYQVAIWNQGNCPFFQMVRFTIWD